MEKEMVDHSSIFPWEISLPEEPDQLQSMGVPKSETWLSD